MAVDAAINAPRIDDSIGALLISVIVSTWLFGVLTIQAYYYFVRFPNDPNGLKVAISVICILDLFHQVFVTATVYQYGVSSWGQFGALGVSHWVASTSYLLEPMVALIVHLYFIRRYWLLSGRNYLMPTVIVLVSFLSFACGESASIITYRLHYFSDYDRWKYLVIMWLIGSAVCDLLVTLTVAWSLWTSKTGFTETDRFITRIMVWVINTGALTSTVAILDAVTFLVRPKTLIHIAFNFLLSKLYANMLLASVNRRRSEVDRECSGRLPQTRDPDHSSLEMTNYDTHSIPPTITCAVAPAKMHRNPSSRSQHVYFELGSDSHSHQIQPAGAPTISTVVSVFDDRVIRSKDSPAVSSILMDVKA